MAVQVSYPGVYIEEFTPGAPIEGVGTSTLGAVGTALRGPIKEARLVSSWDDFVREFGDIPTDGAQGGYLAHGMFGFFQNGGTQAYVVRAATGAHSFANFIGHGGGANPVLVARAIAEGVAGDAIVVEITDSSALASALNDAMAARTITGFSTVTVARDTVTLAAPEGNQGIAIGTVVRVMKAGAIVGDARVIALGGTNKVTLDAAVGGGPSTTGFSLTFASFVNARYAEADVSAPVDNGDGTATVTVSSAAAFPVGTRVTLTDSSSTNADTPTTVRAVEPGDKLVVDTFAPIAGYDGLRLSDWTAGQRSLRLVLPNAVGIGSVLPRGTLVQITPPGGGAPFITTIDSSGGDTIMLAAGLPVAMSLADPTDLPQIESLEFDIEIHDPAVTPPEDRTSPDFEATRAHLAMHPDHPRYWAKTFSSQSITLSEDPLNPPAPDPDTRPVAAVHALQNGQDDDRAAAWADITADPDTYLNILRPIDEVAIVAIPGATDVVVQRSIIDHCESMRDRFAILDSAFGFDLQQIRTQFAGVRSNLGFAALYYPWIKVRNPRAKRDEYWPPSGHIAGVFARTDHLRGVHKAPANTDIRGAFAVERKLTDDEQGPLNLMGVNVIRVFPEQSTPVVWGARTTATDRNWQYVNIRRLFLFLEESIEEGIRWAVFEPNDLALWHKLKRSISAFLTGVWRDGALFGATADKAFYVRIDESLNPPSTRALGRLYLEIGVVPTYPAEFIIVRIGIWDGGADVSEA